MTTDIRNTQARQELPQYRAIDSYIAQHMRRLKIPGVSLAIVEGDKITHLRGFGRARPGGDAPTPRTPFLIGSLTKSFTALAVMQLVEAGKLELDAPVQHYLSWFRVADECASAQITVRHLLNQTGGLPTSSGEIILADFEDSSSASERQARALSSCVLAHSPGTAFEYSNSNYQLLGLIVEAASGESYAHYIQAHIFEPLGMRHSYTSPAPAKKNDLAVGHRYWFGFPVAAPEMPLPRGALAAGVLISTAEDLARWLIAQLNGGRCGGAQILSGAGIDELHRGAVDWNAFGISMQYGMGWFIGKLGETMFIWHGGTLPHFGAYMALLPEQKKGVVLLFNACHYWFNPVLAEVGMGVTALLAGEQPAHIPIVGLIPWMLRAQLLLPIFQLGSASAVLPIPRRANKERQLGRDVLLPLVPNLLAVVSAKPLLSNRRRFLMLYMPDYAWLALVCGGMAGIWSALGILSILRSLDKKRGGLP